MDLDKLALKTAYQINEIIPYTWGNPTKRIAMIQEAVRNALDEQNEKGETFKKD